MNAFEGQIILILNFIKDAIGHVSRKESVMPDLRKIESCISELNQLMKQDAKGVTYAPAAFEPGTRLYFDCKNLPAGWRPLGPPTAEGQTLCEKL